MVSNVVLDELVRNITSKRAALFPYLSTMLKDLHPEVIGDPPDDEIVVWRDAGFGTDAPVLAAANLAQVDAFCTGDRGILTKADYCASFGLTIVTPRWLLDQLSDDRP